MTTSRECRRSDERVVAKNKQENTHFLMKGE
jgi:hypothetical protein